MRTGRQIRLRRHPDGPLRPDDLEVVEVPVAEPAEGQVLVRNEWFALDPALRLRLDRQPPPGYLAPIPLGTVPPGFAVGTVQVSQVDGYIPGDRVTHAAGWQEWAVVEPGGTSQLPAGGVDKIDADVDQARHYLGILGATGLTAYAGLLDVGELRDGDVVWVSAAAGAVGSVVSQLAKLRGHTVIGSAGSPEKVRYLTEELGLDAAFSRRGGGLVDKLRQASPEGIDLYFDNVGGDHLAAALAVLRTFGRVAACGAITGYQGDVPGPTAGELFQVVANRITIRGMRAGDHLARRDDLRRELAPVLAAGGLRPAETIYAGVETAPQAFVDLLTGVTTGRVFVRLD